MSEYIPTITHDVWDDLRLRQQIIAELCIKYFDGQITEDQLEYYVNQYRVFKIRNNIPKLETEFHDNTRF